MKGSQGVLALVVIFAVAVDGRVYYLQNADESRYSGSTYPIPDEQSSRDLDLSFAAGDSGEADDTARPIKKVYTLVAPERPYIGANRVELPAARYKLVEAPVKRAGLDDVVVVPEESRKTVKINGSNKGEVILELRVIANHDAAS